MRNLCSTKSPGAILDSAQRWPRSAQRAGVSPRDGASNPGPGPARPSPASRGALHSWLGDWSDAEPVFDKIAGSDFGQRAALAPERAARRGEPQDGTTRSSSFVQRGCARRARIALRFPGRCRAASPYRAQRSPRRRGRAVAAFSAAAAVASAPRAAGPARAGQAPSATASVLPRASPVRSRPAIRRRRCRARGPSCVRMDRRAGRW